MGVGAGVVHFSLWFNMLRVMTTYKSTLHCFIVRAECSGYLLIVQLLVSLLSQNLNEPLHSLPSPKDVSFASTRKCSNKPRAGILSPSAVRLSALRWDIWCLCAWESSRCSTTLAWKPTASSVYWHVLTRSFKSTPERPPPRRRHAITCPQRPLLARLSPTTTRQRLLTQAGTHTRVYADNYVIKYFKTLSY